MRNRTADLLLTMETLCLLSYRGAQMPLNQAAPTDQDTHWLAVPTNPCCLPVGGCLAGRCQYGQPEWVKAKTPETRGLWSLPPVERRRSGSFTTSYSADALASPLAEGNLTGMHTADTIAQSARLGWMPFYPQFNVNPLDLADQAAAAVEAGEAPDAASYVANALAAGTIKWQWRTRTRRRTGHER
jgi:hypothetical protein